MALRPAVHNVIHLVLATLGVVMIVIAYLDVIDHPFTLWMSLP